jgi:nucleoid-associated protein YejK
MAGKTQLIEVQWITCYYLIPVANYLICVLVMLPKSLKTKENIDTTRENIIDVLSSENRLNYAVISVQNWKLNAAKGSCLFNIPKRTLRR